MLGANFQWDLNNRTIVWGKPKPGKTGAWPWGYNSWAGWNWRSQHDELMIRVKKYIYTHVCTHEHTYKWKEKATENTHAQFSLFMKTCETDDGCSPPAAEGAASLLLTPLCLRTLPSPPAHWDPWVSAPCSCVTCRFSAPSSHHRPGTFANASSKAPTTALSKWRVGSPTAPLNPSFILQACLTSNFHYTSSSVPSPLANFCKWPDSRFFGLTGRLPSQLLNSVLGEQKQPRTSKPEWLGSTNCIYGLEPWTAHNFHIIKYHSSFIFFPTHLKM